MTFRENLIFRLQKNGLSESQAIEIMNFANDKLEELQDMHGFNLDCKTDDYPPMIANILFNILKIHALKWIEINIPQAWFKPMFQ